MALTLEEANRRREALILEMNRIQAELVGLNRIIKELNKIKMAEDAKIAHQRKLREIAAKQSVRRPPNPLAQEKQALDRMMRSNSNRYAGDDI